MFLSSAHSFLPTVSASSQAFNAILEALRTGEMVAGTPVNDGLWAERLEVSRTPVREAIKRLENLGLVEIAPARFTRISTFTPETARQELIGWVGLHNLALTDIELHHNMSLPGLLAAQNRYTIHVSAGDLAKAAVANFDFFAHLREHTTTPSVQLGALSSAYRLRLAEPFLPDVFDPAHVAVLHNEIIQALEFGSIASAHSSLTHWRHH